MSRVHKKLLGFLGLALVLGITAIAAGIPTVQEASANSSSANFDVMVTVASISFGATITNPQDGATLYDGHNHVAAINYTGASEIVVYLTAPNGTRVEIYRDNPSQSSGSINLPLNLSSYGEYTLEVEGRDMGGNFMYGDAVSFFYSAISATDRDNGIIRINLGPAVCRLSFSVFLFSDTEQNNLLIEYKVQNVASLPGYPDYVDIEIPGLASLAPDQQYTVSISACDCAGGNIPLENIEIVINGPISPPNTGSINVLGLTISRTDYIVTGLAAFFTVAIFAFFLLRRKKDQR